MAWRAEEAGYHLGFNRDEQWSRPVSADPAWEREHPVAGACARDPQAGGTWLFTNDRGVTLAVMNSYPGGTEPEKGKVEKSGKKEKKSRGEIPFFAARYGRVTALEEALFHNTWEEFAPCDILLVAPEEVRHYGWDGCRFVVHPPPSQPFLTTSSVRSEAVRAARLTRFRLISTLPIEDILDDKTADDAASAIHVCREDGGTVSRTMVRVGVGSINLSVARRGEPGIEVAFPRRS